MSVAGFETRTVADTALCSTWRRGAGDGRYAAAAAQPAGPSPGGALGQAPAARRA